MRQLFVTRTQNTFSTISNLFWKPHVTLLFYCSSIFENLLWHMTLDSKTWDRNPFPSKTAMTLALKQEHCFSDLWWECKHINYCWRTKMTSITYCTVTRKCLMTREYSVDPRIMINDFRIFSWTKNNVFRFVVRMQTHQIDWCATFYFGWCITPVKIIATKIIMMWCDKFTLILQPMFKYNSWHPIIVVYTFI